MEKKLELNNLDIFLKSNQLVSVIRTLESDRKRIAHELHDDISSKLNVISLNCHLLKIPNLSSEDNEEIMKNIIEYTSKALNSSKEMAYSLLPPVLDKFGLHAGIEELCAELDNNESVVIQYESKLKFDFEDNESHIHIFRILQELLTNSIEHGKATVISILFEEINGKRTCIYSDNGIGFELKQIEEHNGLGMKIIVSRVAILEGNITIESQLNDGISVIFNF
ncbi:sensor histidine kinase [Flavobacterium laiguense]|uniref:Two-component sensor histidine kinase n=1 Tax=Flavobacterium laiguense TaxID=2169409 RepID=A0A2U1JMC9_9FLAO|nr:ATP-binding protein [Flavobacterium laiguense]PWA06033.1 two-component sensor histidine kinase [Flavobacterium laiguense]